MKTDDKNPNARPRRQHSAEEKVRLLRLHLLEGKPISAICEEHDIHPTLFYQWQKIFFENGTAAFDRTSRSQSLDVGQQRIEQLEAKLKHKDWVISTVTEEYLQLKKDLGEA